MVPPGAQAIHRAGVQVANQVSAVVRDANGQ